MIRCNISCDGDNPNKDLDPPRHKPQCPDWIEWIINHWDGSHLLCVSPTTCWRRLMWICNAYDPRGGTKYTFRWRWHNWSTGDHKTNTSICKWEIPQVQGVEGSILGNKYFNAPRPRLSPVESLQRTCDTLHYVAMKQRALCSRSRWPEIHNNKLSRNDINLNL